MYNDLKSGVLALATAFKTGAEQVLYIIGKKYFLMGIYAWTIVLFGIIIGIVGLVKISKIDFEKLTEGELNPLPTLFSIALIIFGFMFVICNIQDAINYTFNPQYYVLQEVIDMVKTLKQ